MAPREKLQAVLQELAGPNKVYFQPPENVQLSYPCIIYQRDTSDTSFANNHPYLVRKRYQITVIDRDPDSLIPDKVAKLPMCTHERFYVADNLNHDVFNIFF